MTTSLDVADNFVTSLESFGQRPALIGSNDRLTYEDLARLAARSAEMIGGVRRLVFLEATNTSKAIATYLGCLLGGHVVYLFAPQDRSKVMTLAERYQPNRLFLARNGTLELESSHDRTINLHPSLRVLLATSGSTGSPKFVKLSERNITSNARSIAEYLQLDSDERALTSLKFNYSYGMSVVNSHLASGAALVLTEHSVVDQEFWNIYRDRRATSFAGVPYTFEVLAKLKHEFFRSRDLRYVTQAGGKLAPELVRHYAGLGETHGWRFYVMYGQTEASPRISYLPPAQASKYPDSIGIAIPGGRLELLDGNGQGIDTPDTPGELAYSGPNVMMGYAETTFDLGTDSSPPRLLTGDIATKNSSGMFFITGRSSRFVKPFGVRLNLDDVESQVRRWAPASVCAGARETVVIAIVRPEIPSDIELKIQELAALYTLPPFAFRTAVFDEIPRLSNGKPDFQSIISQFQIEPPASPKEATAKASPLRHALSIVRSRDFLTEARKELHKLFGGGSESWKSVADIFAAFLSSGKISPESSFTDLAGDSLSYVQTSLALEEYLGSLPSHWERMTVAELEQRRLGNESI